MDKQYDSDPVTENEGHADEAAVSATRRKFLKQAGKFAAYTPPAVMMLMKPSFAAVNQSAAGRPPVVVPGSGGPPSGDPRDQIK